MIESWGRGIERIFSACLKAGVPKPIIRFETTGIWVEFNFKPEENQAATDASGWSTSPKNSVKTRVKTPEKILASLSKNPNQTLAEIALALGNALSTIERVSSKLSKEGRLKYVGPKKGGHWEVLK
jgi:ATP-dependent DNA helicase RecG